MAALADLTELSRSQANEAIKAGTVLVNGKSCQVHVFKEGDTIPMNCQKSLGIWYEDIPLILITRCGCGSGQQASRHGWFIHQLAATVWQIFLASMPLYRVKDLSSINGVVRPGIVHRIDKDTSGLLMIAKNDKAHNALAAELKDKKSLRKYVAIVHGNLPNDRGVIEAPIGRSDKDRKKQAVTAKGKPAVTRFTVLERFGNYTLVELQLETGRTHQIRVHMAYIGHPVAGDPLYGPRKTLKGHGQFLHAKTLGFTHPTTGELVEFTAEDPAIFKETLEKLREA